MRHSGIRQLLDPVVQSSFDSQGNEAKDAFEMFADIGLAWGHPAAVVQQCASGVDSGATCLEGQLRHLLHRHK